MKSVNSIIFIVILTLISLSAISANGKENVKSSYIKVIYFHTDYRCATCNKLESYTGESIKKYFSKELKSGKVILEIINYEEEKNEHFVEEFNLYNKSLVVIKVENGKQKEWKNLDKIWEKVSDKNDYFKYVKNEVKEYLSAI